jgi:hypothetical protein
MVRRLKAASMTMRYATMYAATLFLKPGCDGSPS